MKTNLYEGQSVHLKIDNKVIFNNTIKETSFFNPTKEKEYYTKKCTDNDSLLIFFSINQLDTSFTVDLETTQGLMLGASPEGRFYIVFDDKKKGFIFDNGRQWYYE